MIHNKPGFYCGVGIENGWMAQHDPKIRPGKRLLDVFLQMDHYERWEDDLRLAADLGINAIRYSVPWYKSNPAPGVYDWDWISRPVDWLCDRGLIPIIDLIHYGTPLWMDNGILNAAFPGRFAEYAAAFAAHFGDRVDHYTPCNEPQTSVSYSGHRAYWPPYLHGVDGWLRLSLPLARAMVLASQALRSACDDPVLISAECRLGGPSWKEIQDASGTDQDDDKSSTMLHYYFPASLAYGAVPADSPLLECLARLGADERDLAWFVDHREPPDIFGINYYPGTWHNPEELARKRDDLVGRCQRTYDAYQLPLYITETSGGLSPDEKVTWVDVLRDVIEELRQRGVPLKGVNWWPLFETIQWNYRDNDRTIEECIVPGGWDNGLYVIDKREPGRLERVPTRAVGAFKGLVEELLGDICPS